MKIAIIGSGVLGLTVAERLCKKGGDVTVFETGLVLGGLAGSFGKDSWRWRLEKYYHHIFTGDKAIRKGFKFSQPRTDSYVGGGIRQLDSPISVLKFDQIGIFSRLRMGLGLLMLKLVPNGVFLERFGVEKYLPFLVGRQAYERIWERLLCAKFGKYVGRVNLAWFWARIAKRTKSLGYFDGGFDAYTKKLANEVTRSGGKIIFNKRIQNVEKLRKEFDKVIVTTPMPVAEAIIGRKLTKKKIDYLWGQTVVIETKQSLMSSYWLNILEKDWPFLVMVEHTNFVDKKNYGGNHLIYFGNYLEDGDERLKMTKEELLNRFEPYIRKINKDFDRNQIVEMWKFQDPYAQPVFPVNYSREIPDFEVKVGLFVANMSMVYPYDRGTNYAVELGLTVARAVDVK